MATRPARDVEAALLAKGMERDPNHHWMFRMTVEGATHLVTRISHNAKEIDDGLAQMMAKQCCLQQREFWNLVGCPLSNEEWLSLVRKRCPDGRNPFLGY